MRYRSGSSIYFCIICCENILQYWNVAVTIWCHFILWTWQFDWVLFERTTTFFFFLLYQRSLFLFSSLIAMYFILPETENRSLEDIELHYSDNKKKITDIHICMNGQNQTTEWYWFLIINKESSNDKHWIFEFFGEKKCSICFERIFINELEYWNFYKAFILGTFSVHFSLTFIGYNSLSALFSKENKAHKILSRDIFHVPNINK